MLRPHRHKTLGLTLGSGGAKGFSHIAFLKALDNLAVKPAIISGTSAGAVMGAFYAAGMTADAINDVMSELDFPQVARMVGIWPFQNSGLLQREKVESFLTRSLPASTFEELEIPLKVVATDFWARRAVIFDSGPLVPALCASIAVPVLFEPVTYNDMVLTDGGTVNPLPFDIIRDECDILAAIDVSGTRIPDQHDPVPSPFENIFATFQIMQTSIVRNMMEHSRPDIYIKPELADFQLLDLHRRVDIIRGVGKDVERFAVELNRLMQ
jgi:NTE family protein